MANKLPVNFKDDILATSMAGQRRYIITDNGDGTHIIEDVSTYDQVGSNYGASQINETNQAVNDLIDNQNTIVTATGTLTTGSTSLTITNSAIKTTSFIDVYSNVFGVAPTNMVINNGSVTFTFDAQDKNISIAIRIIS